MKILTRIGKMIYTLPSNAADLINDFQHGEISKAVLMKKLHRENARLTKEYIRDFELIEDAIFEIKLQFPNKY